jgi:hypothetical protein
MSGMESTNRPLYENSILHHVIEDASARSIATDNELKILGYYMK